jgi:hypothetical protein
MTNYFGFHNVPVVCLSNAVDIKDAGSLQIEILQQIQLLELCAASLWKEDQPASLCITAKVTNVMMQQRRDITF